MNNIDPSLRVHIKPKAMAVIRRVQNGRTQILATPGLDTVKNEKFYRLIGGHIEFGETARACLLREMTEELGPDVRVDVSGAIRWIENIFTYNGDHGHEIIALCDALIDDPSSIRDTYPILDYPDLFAEWVDEDAAKSGQVRLYPIGAV
jgi:8-oxo-dGTP pyrophosphatase MutT (NUDIX family)